MGNSNSNTVSQGSQTLASNAAGPTRFARAYAAFEPPWLSPKPEKIDFDITRGVCLALDALPRIEAVRDRLSTLDGQGPFRLEQVDALERCALAAAHADARHLAATDLDTLLDSTVQRGHNLRELLIANTHVLEMHGVVTAAEARAFQGLHGYQDIAAELLGLVEFWNAIAGRVAGRTFVTPLHLIEAECYADQILLAVGALGQEYSEAELAALSAERESLFTAFHECYDPIRAALTFLFHEEDNGIAIAPAISPRDKRGVRIAQLELKMRKTPRDQWDPLWELEFDDLYDSK
jgi:hypothetical protein